MVALAANCVVTRGLPPGWFVLDDLPWRTLCDCVSGPGGPYTRLIPRDMMCEVLGDSIAVGVAWAMPACHAQVIGGISAGAFDTRFHGCSADVTAISLGNNAGAPDEAHLRSIRSKITGRVVWLQPPGRVRELIAQLAKDYGDGLIDVRSAGATGTHIHPPMAGYRTLAGLIAATP